jgi:hypothetical protein
MWFTQGCRHGTMLWQSFRGKCRPHWPKQSRSQTVMHWETHCSPHLPRKVRGRARGTTITLVGLGSSIALITGTKEEMTGRITGTVRPKWRP